MVIKEVDILNKIKKEIDLFENPYVRSYDRLIHNIRVLLNISENLNIFYSRLFSLISDELSILTGAQFVRYKYSIVGKYLQKNWIEKQKIPVENERNYKNIFDQVSQISLEKQEINTKLLQQQINTDNFDVTIKYYYGENEIWKYSKLDVNIKNDSNDDSFKLEWLSTYTLPDNIKFLSMIYLISKKINYNNVAEYEVYLKEKESKYSIFSKTNQKQKYNEFDKYLLEKPDEYIFRIILMIIRQKVFRHLDDIQAKYIQNNLDIKVEKPMGFFYLKAFYDSQNKLCGFGYFFDIEQINHLKDYVKLRDDYVLLTELRYLESKNMMKAGRDRGLCFTVYEKKDFAFTINWKNYTKDHVYSQTIELEDRFLTESQLYEWPIYDNENQLIYIACLNISNKKIRGEEVPLTTEQIEKIHRIIESEFQLNIDYYLTVKKYLEENKERQYLIYQIRNLNWRNNHQYEGRFFRPIQHWIDEISDNLQNQTLLFSEQFIKYSDGIKKRIKMFHKVMNVQDYTSPEYVNNGALINLDEFKKNISDLMDCELETRKSLKGKDYSIIDFSIIHKNDLSIRINEDSLEAVVYNILVNAIDVFDESSKVYTEFTIVLDIAKGSDDYAVFEIKNTGSIGDEILSSMNKIFLEIKTQGYEVENYLETYLENKSASHSGFSLVRIARLLFAKIEGDRHGYLEVSQENKFTVFKIFIPLSS